jgi:hypothetical protein
MTMSNNNTNLFFGILDGTAPMFPHQKSRQEDSSVCHQNESSERESTNLGSGYTGRNATAQNHAEDCSFGSVEERLNEADVICARNKRATKHPGNCRYQAFVRAHREVYQTSKLREEKSIITRSVIEKVKEYGGRFVRYNKKTGTWNDIDADTAYDKVSHALRSGKEEQQKRLNTKTRNAQACEKRDEALLASNSDIKRIYFRQQNLFEKINNGRELEVAGSKNALLPCFPSRGAPVSAATRKSSSNSSLLLSSIFDSLDTFGVDVISDLADWALEESLDDAHNEFFLAKGLPTDRV